ncbi:AAA family ATPase [Algicella marina]|uniref:AAA family ATPase n=1 Tax=Algicella marina TaxID=2683284 RepID=A0A6P1T6E3_9RHOB|nr:ATP-binding protein [Algicella marina]QHQ37046.1 AAA family ATPase [Algicella marina]
MPTEPTLHMLCGKPASGKSTLAGRLADAPRTVCIAEDAWLATLFGDEMSTLSDYVRCSAKLREIMAPHVATLLGQGLSVVLDFPANTIETREWMRGILDRTHAAHVLHVLDLPDESCLERLRARNAAGEHPFAATEAQFRRLSAHYRPPSADEGFNVRVYTDTA